MKYDYKCPWCGEIVEIELPLKVYVEEGEKQVCPKCKKEYLLRTYTKLANFVMEKKE